MSCVMVYSVVDLLKQNEGERPDERGEPFAHRVG